MSYGRQFHIAGEVQRKARDPIFVCDEHGSSCLSSAEDLNGTSKNLARDTGSQICWFTGLQEFVRKCGDLIVYAPLDGKPMKLLQSIGDADATSLTCNNKSERVLQTLKPRNVLNRDPHHCQVGVIDATADERTGNVLGAV